MLESPARIAVLAWGSLIWARGELCIRSEWNPDGPTLPLEFSRISNDGRLTLVVDPVSGSPIKIWFALSCFESLDDTIGNLRDREGTNLQNIGYVDVTTGRSCSRHVDVDRMIAWSKERSCRAVAWTDLEPNFASRQGRAFDPETAIEHLRSLPRRAAHKAFAYIRNAPSEVDTPLRRAAVAEWPELGLVGSPGPR
jgi:hypothetical protein